MARKVFVSYKYKDTSVADLRKTRFFIKNDKILSIPRKTIVRDYVSKLQAKIGKEHINLGEKEGESLANFSDETIETSLKNRIKQCSITIILISKGMKESNKQEKDQWIPWEVSYSLRTIPTGGNTKQMNAILGIVLPDETNTYDWYFDYKADCNCTTNYTGKLFKILKDNTFNIIDKKFRECDGRQIYINDEPSFFKTVKWNDFMNGNNYNNYLEKAIEIKNNKDAYDVHINLD